MKVTYNWLKDFVEIKLSPEALAEKLTMAGLEVTSLEKKEGDWVFEIEVTSNRPDWLSVMGVAREVAAITNCKLKIINPKPETNPKSKTPKSKTKLSIKTEDKKDCPLYTAAIIINVKVKPSPEWMQARLAAVGVRPVNNIVDITNYVLLETAEPLHAFDLAKIKQEPGLNISVRRAKKEEKILTIDGKERILGPDILVIADNKRAVAVAGVIGGKDSEVSETTQSILLEAAKFSPLLIRRMRRKFGINTESSYRFERDVDIEMVNKASLKAQALIREIVSGETTLFKSEPSKISVKKRDILLDSKKVEKILGVKIPQQKIIQIFKGLGLATALKKGKLRVAVPNVRRDLQKEVDLIEEACRIYGYERIPVTIPPIIPQKTEATGLDLYMLIRELLTAQGLNEAITLSLTSEELLKKCGLEDSPGIPLANPLSRDLEVLRPGLIPSLVSCVGYNLNRKAETIQLFEIAKGFSQPHKEETKLGIALCGPQITIFHLKGILETLFKWLGINEYVFISESSPIMGKNICFSVSVKNKKIGLLGKVDTKVLQALDIKHQSVFCAQINLEEVRAFINLGRNFVAPPVFPSIIRDISLFIKKDVLVKDIQGLIKEKGGTFLKEVSIKDVYSGKQVPEGLKGLTFSCTYRSDERTLSDEEVNRLHANVCGALAEKFSAQLR